MYLRSTSERDRENPHLYRQVRCIRCMTPMQKAIAIDESESEFWWECPKCNTWYNSYIPQPHQLAVHQDPHTFIGNFGGYGSGKTLTSREEIYKHIFLTPNANILVGANVSSQYEQTIKRDIEGDFPKHFVKNISAQKSYIDFINGARLMFRPLDDIDKLRSYNLTMFLIIEASEVNPEAFTQLKTRLRNSAASSGTTHWLRGIIESNPDNGWVATEVLYPADEIYTHGEVQPLPKPPEDMRDSNISVHVTSTTANKYLPLGFEEQITRNKPKWWIDRYLYGSFSYSDGRVYPSAMAHVIDPFDIPKHWRRIVAADYGLHDDFVYLFGALDEKKGIVYIYKEVRTNNKNLQELAQMYFDASEDIPQGAYYTSPIIDPKSGNKRDYDKKTLIEHFMEYGIYFQPGAVKLDARIFRVNTYLESNRLKIMSSCTGLVQELKEYRFARPSTSAVSSKLSNKPVDKNNHAINPLEWICMALPEQPNRLQLGSFDEKGRPLKDKEERYYKQVHGVPVQLMDNQTNTEEDYIWSF